MRALPGRRAPRAAPPLPAKPRAVFPGQRWRFMAQESVVTRVLPGGGGNLGIAEFADSIPTSHVSTMLSFPAWSHVPTTAVAPPCRCIAVGDGVMLTDGCSVHGGGAAIVVEAEPAPDFRARSHRYLNRPKEALCP